MNEKFDTAILTELKRIVARYGPGTGIRLAELIRDPKRAEELASALESMTAVQFSQSKARPKLPTTDRVGMAVLNSLRLSDPEKHSLVAEIRRELLSGRLLPSIDEFRRFARMHGIAIGRASSRYAAIAPFLRSLSQLSTPEIVSLRNSLIHSNASDRSLARWREVIVKPRPPQNPEK